MYSKNLLKLLARTRLEMEPEVRPDGKKNIPSEKGSRPHEHYLARPADDPGRFAKFFINSFSRSIYVFIFNFFFFG